MDKVRRVEITRFSFFLTKVMTTHYDNNMKKYLSEVTLAIAFVIYFISLILTNKIGTIEKEIKLQEEKIQTIQTEIKIYEEILNSRE
jgi:hypothetical protein